MGRTAGPADLVILAPSPEESARADWLGKAVRDAAASLSQDGLLYLLAYRRQRRELQALLNACGLAVVVVLLHHPNWAEARTLIPLESGPLTYAFSRLIRTNLTRRSAALTIMGLPGVLPLVRRLLPAVGLVAQRPGARRQTTWFTRLLQTQRDDVGVVLSTSWRGQKGAVLLHAVHSRQGQPLAIAKTWLSAEGEATAAREAAGLEEIARRAADAGARTPTLLQRGWLGEQPYLVETAVSGEKASVLLQRRPEQLEDVLGRLVKWLLVWNLTTVQRKVLSQEMLEELLLRPGDELAASLGVGEGYNIYVAGLAHRLLGRQGTFVATHGDLTMVNVLIDQDMRLGVIDWETAKASGLPLADLFYTAVDAVAALDDYRDRPAAFRACFAPGGRYRSLVADLQARFVDQLALTPDQIALSFHASWLSYALAERRETAKAAPDEFLRIARGAAFGVAGRETELATLERA
jgi:aminoglycoside phosphotransferase